MSHRTARRTAALALACVAAPVTAGCGDDDDASSSSASTAATTPARGQFADVKTYLLGHTGPLAQQSADLAARPPIPRARRVGRLRLRGDCSTSSARTWASRSPRCRTPGARPTRTTRRWRASSPACPELADYDVIIDAGSDAVRPGERRAVRHQDADGRVFKKPGNFFFLTETAALRAPTRSSPPRTSRPISTATARWTSARRCRTPNFSSPPRATSRRQAARARRVGPASGSPTPQDALHRAGGR